MNPHLKVAYDHGVQKALEDAGLSVGSFEKVSGPTPEEQRAGELFSLPFVAAQIGGELAAQKAFQNAGESTVVTRDQAQKLINSMGLQEQYGSDKRMENKLRNRLVGKEHRISFKKHPNMPGAFYDFLTGEIFLDPHIGQASPDVLAHELGHATSSKSGLGNLLRRASFKSFYPAAIGASVLTSGGVAFTDPDGDNPYLIPALGAAAQVPRVAEEGLASVKAMKALRDTGDYDELTLRKMRGRLTKAGLTYLAAGLGAAVTPFAARYGQRNYGED